MARKSGRTSVEVEIERCREEERWENIVELVKQLPNHKPFPSVNYDSWRHLLSGEALLESFLLTHDWTMKGNLGNVKKELSDALSHLHKAVKSQKGPKVDCQQEAAILLSKGHFVSGEFEDALKYLDQSALDKVNWTCGLSRRTKKLLAEGFAIKGMSLEKLDISGQSHMNLDDIIICYDKASDVAVWLFTDLDKPLPVTGQRVPSPPPERMPGSIGVPLETAIQKTSMLLIKQGKLDKAISRMRYLLRIVETKPLHGLRKILARQLAQIIFCGVCEQTYEKPPYSSVPHSSSAGPLGLASLAGVSVVMSEPLPASKMHKESTIPYKPKMYSGESLFMPRDEMEEVLLLLLLDEAMVLKDAVLSRAEECAVARIHSLADVHTVYDQLTLAFIRQTQYGMLAECFEKGMKLAFEDFHLWFQFALSLISSGKFQRALLVLKQCAVMAPRNAVMLLQAAKICYNNLHEIQEGIQFSKKIIALGDKSDFASKGHLALGIGYSLKAEQAPLKDDRQKLQKQAVASFQRAHSIDPDDCDILFHLALSQASMRQISKAVKNVRQALTLDGSHLLSLQLLALILSAQKKYTEGLDICDGALLEYPDNFGLLLTKVKLEEVVFGGEQALVTCKTLLTTWKAVYDSEMQRSSEELKAAGSGLLDRVVADSRSLKQIPIAELGTEYENNSVDAASSIAASVRLEQALSDEAVSASVSRLSIPAALALQARLWLAIADVFLGMEKESEASACVQEANLIFPLSSDVLFKKGHVCEARGDLSEAKRCYDDAIAITPDYVPSLQRLAMIYLQRGNNIMAEKTLRDAVNIHPTSYLSWHNLGVVLESQSQHEAASDCLIIALDLEATAPIIPLTVIPRVL